MRSGVAMSHNGMITHSNPHFDDCTAASNIHALVRSAEAVEAAAAEACNVQNLEGNIIGHTGRAKILQSITVLHRIECTSIKTLEIRRWSSLEPLRTLRNQ